MTSTTGPLLPLLALVASLSGALLVAALVGGRQRAGGRDRRATPFAAAVRLGAWWLVAGIAASAGWLSDLAVIAVFAAVSALALSRYFAVLPRRPGDGGLRAACYACIPAQYAIVAAGMPGPFATCLPLVVTLALPLLAVAGRDTRDLGDRISEAGFGVLLCVYCVSHVPAVLMLDVQGFAGRAGLPAAFVVIVASAAELASSARTAAGSTDAAISAALAAAMGVALAWLTPFPPFTAGAVALLLALLALLGRVVMTTIAREQGRVADAGAVDARAIFGRPAAIAFAAPVWFHLLRALYGP